MTNIRQRAAFAAQSSKSTKKATKKKATKKKPASRKRKGTY